MVQAVSSETARKGRVERLLDGHGYQNFGFHKSLYIGPNKFTGPVSTTDDNPQSYLIEQVPGSFNPPHFHQVDQFQVFVSGSGKLGRNDARPFALHYTDHHTAYGPIVAGDEGLAYFTLRAQSDPGARVLPMARDEIRPSRRRTLAGTVAERPAESLRSLAGPVVEDVFPAQDDGVWAGVVRLGPGGGTTGPEPAAGGGQYWVVLRGSLVLEGVAYPELSCLYVYATDPALSLAAGPGGVEVLCTQFPRKP